MELLVEVAGAQVAPDAVDVYPAPVERARIRLRASRVNAVLGTDLDAEDVWDSLAPLGIELDDARSTPTTAATTVVADRPDVPPRPRPRDRPGRGGGAPHRLRPHRPHAARHPRPGRHAHAPPAGAAPRRRRARRRRALGGDHALAGVARRPRARRRAARPRRARHQPAARPRSRCCAPRCSPACCARWPATGRRVSPTSRCSRWAACSSRRSTVGAPATARCPTNPSTSRSPGRARCAGARSRTTARSTCTTRSTRCGWCSTRSASTTSALQPDALTGYRAGRAARVVVDGHDAGTVGEVAPEVLAALGLDAPVVAAELVLDTLLDAARRDRTFRAPSRFPASSVDLAFVLADTVATADVLATLRAAVGDALEDVRAVRRVHQRRVRSRSPEPRVRAALPACPTARSPTPTWRPSASRRSTRSSPPTTPNCGAERLASGCRSGRRARSQRPVTRRASRAAARGR